jgi:myo-inositol-1(or 4)-monophosphatase
MFTLNLEEICNDTIKIAKEAGEYIRTELRNRGEELNVETKGLHNYVTHVDKAAEKLIVNGLKKLLPESGFIAEEGTSSVRGEEYNWIIDPLDGTTNFIHALPPYAVSIGLMLKNELIVGVIYEIALDECFYAWKDGGAYLNGRKIHVSNTSSVKNSLIATGFPYTEFKHLDRFMETLYFFMRNSHGLRRLGSAATDIAYVACGRFEGFYEYGLAPWDIAAGIVILKEAGGRVSDFHGGDDYLFGEEIVAANSNVFNELLESVANIMHKQSLS